MGLIYYEVTSTQPQPSEVKRMVSDSHQILGSLLGRPVTLVVGRESDGRIRQGYALPDTEIEDRVAAVAHCSWRIRQMELPHSVGRCFQHHREIRRGGGAAGLRPMFATWGRGSGYTATGGIRRHDGDIQLLPPDHIDFGEVQLPSLVTQSGPLNLISSVFGIIKKQVLPAHDIAQPQLLRPPGDAHWINLTAALPAHAACAIFAQPFSIDENLRAYIRCTAAKLAESIPGGYRRTALFDAILHGDDVFLVVPAVFGLSDSDRIDRALAAEFGPGTLERTPGTFSERLEKLDPKDRALLAPLSLLYTREEAISLLHFAYSTEAVPALTQRRVSPFGRPHVIAEDGPSILLGHLERDGSPRWEALRLFRSHGALLGRPDTGKTVALTWLASEFIRTGGSVLVLDAVKGEAAQFIGSLGGAVYDLVDNPPPVNFFIPEENELVDQRIGLLVRICTSFRAGTKLAADEWTRLFGHLYGSVAAAAMGGRISGDEYLRLTGRDYRENPAMIPTLEQLVSIGGEWISAQVKGGGNSDHERRAYFIAAMDAILRSRLRFLLRGRPAPQQSIYDLPAAAFTLESVVDVELKRAALIGLLMGLRARRKSQRAAGARISHWTVIDEAHFVVPACVRADGAADIISSSRELAMHVAEALKELRGYGESLILADQSPSELDPAVLRTCKALICFALQEGNDRARAREALGLTAGQAGYLSSLEQGCAIVTLEGRTPYEVHFKMHPNFPG